MATKEDSSPEKASSTLDFGMLEDHLLQSSLDPEEEWPLFGNC